MAENSAIEWTHHTFNAWRGCSKVHAGCTNCYAEVNYSVKMHGVKWGPDGTRVRLSDAGWSQPLKWNRDAQQAGERRRVFCASLADVFEDWQGPILNHLGEELCVCHGCGKYTNYHGECGGGEPLCSRAPRRMTLDDLRRDLFKMIDATPWLDWLLLTKRPENVRRMWPEKSYVDCGVLSDNPPSSFYRDNVWLGTSISDQETADEWVPNLLANGDLAPVLFLSAEPLLGPIDLSSAVIKRRIGDRQPNWVIVGGESGHNARACDIAWIEAIARECDGAGVPLFIKQLGAHPVSMGVDISPPLKDKKGGDTSEWPWPAIRQFPERAKVQS